MFPVGIQLYSVREHAKEDFFGTLKKVREMGYDGVEFAGLFGHKPAEIRDFCADIGLLPVSAHVAIDEILTDPDKVFATYREIGCPYIAIPYLTEDRRPGGKNYENTLFQMASIGEKARVYDLTLLYHNHDFEFQRLPDGRYFLDALYEEIPASFLQTQLDTCWTNIGGEDPAEYLIKYAGRAPVVHLKDFVIKDRKPKPGADLYELIGIAPSKPQADEGDFAFRPVGYGLQDIPAILAAAKTAQSRWLIVEQDNPCLGWDSLECARLSVNYLKKINT